MASPFAVFRRNQKIMLAVVGIGAMVAFVFLDPLMQYLGGPSKQENPVVVETSFGNLTRTELENLKFSREIVDRFLRQVTAQVITAQIGRGNLDPRLYENLADRQYMFWHQQLMGRSQPEPEQAAIETLVLANRAEQMGMVISDQAINDLLKQITSDSVSSAELQEIIRSLQPSRPISVARLFESIRTEMLAAEYARLFIQSLRDVPPAQRFAYYSRLNRRANAEVMSLAVADFAAQVADPTNAEITQFYDKYKNDYPNPDSPEPGFKQPRRATFQFFKADIDQLTEKIKPEITEEEIKKYYEDNKAQFRAFDLDDKAADGTSEPEEGEAKPQADGDGSEKSADEPKSEGATDDDASDAPKADQPVEAEDKPESSDDAEKPNGDEAAPDASKADETPDESAPQAARAPARGIVRLASAILADEEPPAEEPPSEPETPAESPESPPPAETPPAETPPADKEEADKQPADAQPAPGDEGQEAPEKAAEEPAEAQRFEPLEKVQDTIRESLAQQRAADKIGEQFDELSAAMRRYTDDLDLYITEKGTNSDAKPPVPLDFAALAEGKDVTAEDLTSVSAAEAAKTDIGKSFRVVQNPRTQMVNTVPFAAFAFSDALPTYKNETVQDNDNNAYLFWKTQEEGAYVPPLDQIRSQVVQAWKLIKARDVARKRAEEYAAQSRALKKPLSELFGKQENLQIAETGPFTWLTLGNVPADPGAQPRLSDVSGVDRAGTAFMKTVFDLEPVGTGVAFNEPQDLVYVVRLINFEPPLDELRDDFARENPNRYMVAAGDDQRAIYRAWLEDLNEQAGIHWVRQADARRQTDEEAGL